jgi:hypothetical protein
MPSYAKLNQRPIAWSRDDIHHPLATQVPRRSPAAQTPRCDETDQPMG